MIKKQVSILIPTYNRPDELRECLEAIHVFSYATTHDLRVIISDNCCPVPVESIVQNLPWKDKIEVIRRDALIVNGNEHMNLFLSEVSLDSDWYWVLGDDDNLQAGFAEEFDRLVSQEGLGYIHATDAAISLIQPVMQGKVEELVRRFGFLELFSFFSSQILSRTSLAAFQRALLDHSDLAPSEFCFSHSALMCIALRGANGAVSSTAGIKVQDRVHAGGGGGAFPWFQTAHYLRNLGAAGMLQLPAPPSFFHHHKVVLWRKFTLWIINHSVGNSVAPASELLPLIKETVELCSDKNLVINDLLHIDAAFSMMEALFAPGSQVPPLARQSMLNAVIGVHNEFTKPLEFV